MPLAITSTADTDAPTPPPFFAYRALNAMAFCKIRVAVRPHFLFPLFNQLHPKHCPFSESGSLQSMSRDVAAYHQRPRLPPNWAFGPLAPGPSISSFAPALLQSPHAFTLSTIPERSSAAPASIASLPFSSTPSRLRHRRHRPTDYRGGSQSSTSSVLSCTQGISTLILASGKRRLLERVESNDPTLQALHWRTSPSPASCSRSSPASSLSIPTTCPNCNGNELYLLARALSLNNQIRSLHLLPPIANSSSSSPNLLIPSPAQPSPSLSSQSPMQRGLRRGREPTSGSCSGQEPKCLPSNSLHTSPSSLRALIDVLKQHSQLQTLSVCDVELGDAAAHSMATALSQNPSLRQLCFRHTGFTAIGIRSLATELPPRLKFLSLRDNFTGVAGIRCIAAAIMPRVCNPMSTHTMRSCHLPWLRYLDLQSMAAGHRGLIAIATVLSTQGCELRAINLSNNLGGEDGVVAIADALQRNHRSRLKVIDIGGNACGAIGADAFAVVLEQSHCILQSINLSRNEIRDEGAKRLALALRSNRTVRHLNLSANKIEWEGMNFLTAAMNTNGTVTSLNVSLNRSNTPTLHMCAAQIRNRKALNLASQLRGIFNEISSRQQQVMMEMEGSQCEDSQGGEDLDEFDEESEEEMGSHVVGMMRIPEHEQHCINCASLRSHIGCVPSANSSHFVMELICQFLGQQCPRNPVSISGVSS